MNWPQYRIRALRTPDRQMADEVSHAAEGATAAGLLTWMESARPWSHA